MKKHIVLIAIVILVGIVSVSIYTYKSGSRSTEKSQWITQWDELDIAVVKRRYQPHTVAKMQEMWHEKLIDKYGGAERFKQAIGKADDVYPQDTYLARMLDFGRPFVDFSDYENALTEQRIGVASTRIYWENMSTDERSRYLEQRGVPSDATWEMVEETLLKDDVVQSVNFWRSKQQDPYMNRNYRNQADKHHRK